ncbi:amidohydrolase family protein [Pigmentiphaga sp. YJ18]|uniref:amidohydrolase family protein n=1 Tax=Pigmentiphaga sp. YJ18 TaxID=3134907 RepID=UPI0031107EE3
MNAGEAWRRSVDVHTHFVPETLAPMPPWAPAHMWPSIAPAECACHRHVMIDGKNYRTVTDQCWDAGKRKADMEAMRIGMQVVSPMPELLSYWMPGPACAVLHRDLNEQMARLASTHPDRFAALGAVPMQDLDRAIEELEYLAGTLGFPGVEIGSNVNGEPLGLPKFQPFFAAAERLDLCVFVHAIRPAGVDRLVGPASLQQALGFPSEIGLAAASLITGNVLARHPRLRIAFSHGGGTLAMLLPRLENAWQRAAEIKESMLASPTLQAQRMYYDDLVYDAPTISLLLDRFGAGQVMIGTDYPFRVMDREPVERLESLGLDAALRDAVYGDNARRFLGR